MKRDSILIRINELGEVDKYLEKGINNFLFPLKDFSIGYNTFTLEDVNNLNRDINIYLLLNRVLENNDCDNLRKLNIQNKFIIYEDLAVYQILKDSNNFLIWNQAHGAVSYHTINVHLENNYSVMLSNELEKGELSNVIDNVIKPVILPVLGLNMAMYSRRSLISFYKQTFNKDLSDNIIIKNNDLEFLVKENEYGTVYFYNKYYNLIPFIDNIRKNILLYYIDPNNLNCEYVLEIIDGKEIDYDNKFYENKTVYKIGDLK